MRRSGGPVCWRPSLGASGGSSLHDVALIAGPRIFGQPQHHTNMGAQGQTPALSADLGRIQEHVSAYPKFVLDSPNSDY